MIYWDFSLQKYSPRRPILKKELYQHNLNSGYIWSYILKQLTGGHDPRPLAGTPLIFSAKLTFDFPPPTDIFFAAKVAEFFVPDRNVSLEKVEGQATKSFNDELLQFFLLCFVVFPSISVFAQMHGMIVRGNAE